MSKTVYYGIFSFMNEINAANTIKYYWKKYRYSPEYRLCYRIEMKNIDEIYKDYGIEKASLETPDFSEMILKYRRKSFQEQLLEIKKIILTIRINQK